MTTDKLEALEREVRTRADGVSMQARKCYEALSEEVDGSAIRSQLQHTAELAERRAIELNRWANALAAIRAEMGGVTEAIPAGFGCYDGNVVHFIDQDRDECVVESRRDGSLVVDLIVRPAALNPTTGEGEQS